MSPRAFQTIIVASMGSKDRLELESKVLAAALKQSHARGDSSGVSLAHKQIFLLLRQQQTAAKAAENNEEVVKAEPERQPEAEPQVEVSAGPDESGKKRRRVMPDIVWTSEDESDSVETESVSDGREPAAGTADPAVEHTTTDNGDQSGEAHKTGDQGLIDFSSPAAGEDETVASQPAESEGDGEKPNFNAYGILAVEQIASFEEIHRSFLFLVRRILMTLKKAKRKQRKPLLDELQNLWIAHDILSDPVTRTDFDFRVLGLRGAPDVLIHSAPEDRSDSISSRTPLRIGELMQCAELLEATELEIAADMHKAMPEMLFGAFLVKQGFISEEDLGQVLTGQRLLKNGNMTVGHYQLCMKSWREDRVPIEETAVAEGFVTQQEMDRVIASGQRDTVTGAAAYPGNNVTLRATAPQINQEEAAKRKFSAGHAVPLWKDQLDWSEPEAIQAYVDEEPDFEHRKPVESSLDIEGITDAVTSKDGKKSLRRLMEGIHSSPDSNSAEESGVNKSLKNIFGSGVDTGPQPAQAAPESPPKDVAADARAAELVLKDAQAAAASSQRDAYEEDAEPVVESAPEFDYQLNRIKETGALPALSAANTPEGVALSDALLRSLTPEARPTAEVPIPTVVMEGGSSSASSAHDDNVFGEVNYDDEDDAEGDADLAYVMDGVSGGMSTYSEADEVIESYGDAPSSVTETASIETPSVGGDMDDLLDFSTSTDGESASEIRKVLDEAFHGVRTSETEVLSVNHNQEMTIASSDDDENGFDALADEDAEMESGVYEPPKEMAANSDETKTDGNHQDLSAVVEAVQSASSAESPGEMRLSSIIIESVEKEPADESTGETPAVASSDVEIGAREESAAEPVVNGSADDQNRVSGESDDTAAGGVLSRATVSMELPPIVKKLDGTPESSIADQAITRGLEGVGASCESVNSNEQSFDDQPGDSALEAEPSSTEHAASEVSAGEAPEGTDEDDTTPDDGGSSSDDELPGNEQTEDESNPQDQLSASEEDTQNPPVQSVDEPTESSKPDSQTPVAALSTGENDTLKLTDVSGSIPDIAPLEEAPSTRLKSGEWQIVYKLEGSIADQFLSEDEEEQMPRMRPRLTEIDSIIPSSISKLAKSDTSGSGATDSTTDQDAVKEDGSDKPVIKPVSNNYNRNDKSKSGDKSGKSGDKGDKSDKGKGK